MYIFIFFLYYNKVIPPRNSYIYRFVSKLYKYPGLFIYFARIFVKNRVNHDSDASAPKL